MADLLRRTSASNFGVHEIALSDQTGDAELFIPQNDHELIYGLASLEPAAGASSKEGVTVSVPPRGDMRDAPSIPLITALQDMDAEVRAFDPVGMPQARKVLENVTFCKDVHDCAKGAHALVIRDGVGAVSRARSQGNGIDHGLFGHYRSSQHLLAGGGDAEWLSLCGVGRPAPVAY
jgi:hypothetical protein